MISVVVPCRNQATYLRTALESVIVQTRRDFEIVVVDDASDDGTGDLVRRIRAENPSVPMRLVTHASQRGLSAARNSGIEHSSGELIVPLDADDFLAPTYLQTCAAVMESDVRTSIVHSDRMNFGGQVGVVSSASCNPRLLFYENQLGYCSMYRRGVWLQIGGYPDNYPIQGYEDWEFWLAAATHKFKFAHADGLLWYYRVRADGMAGSAALNDEYLRARMICRHARYYHPDSVTYARKVMALGPARGAA